MAIMLKKNNESIILDNTDEAFTGTPLADESFMIEISKLKRADNINILNGSVDEDGNIKQGDYSKKHFIASISAVDGFVDENQAPISIEDGVRELIWEHGSDVLVTTINSKIKSFNILEEKKTEVLEDDLVPTVPGQ